MSDAPTRRQLEVLRAVRDMTRAQRGIPPTVRQMCDALGIGSTNGMADHLRALMKKELLEYGHRRVVLLTPRGLSELKADEKTQHAAPK